MRMQVTFIAVATAMFVASAAQAAIVLQGMDAGTALGQGGLSQFTISAVATEGETINTFSFLNLTGNVHQVWAQSLGGPQPTPNYDASFSASVANDPEWREYDSYFLIPSANTVGIAGDPLTETNDMSTTGTLGLPQVSGLDAPAGFGELGSATVSYALKPEFSGSEIPFLQVVTTQGTAYLDIRIDGKDAAGDDAMTSFGQVPIGAVPEPASIALVGLALVGLLGSRRKQ